MESLRTSDGWKWVEHLFATWEQKGVDELLRYQGSDMNVLRSKQLSLRILRETQVMLRQEIDAAIMAGKQILLNNVR